MPKVEDIQPDGMFKGLFTGRSGTGKTSAACSYPPPVEVWDFDGRIRGVLGCPWVSKKDLIYESFPPKEPGMILRIMKKVDTMQQLAVGRQLAIKTLVIDSLTSETFAMLCQAKPLLAKEIAEDKKGKRISGYRMTGPEEYSFEADTTYNLLASLRSIPGINLIVTAHIVARFGKENPDDPFSNSVEVGEKLSVRDKIGENVQIYFDNVFRFDKVYNGGRDHHTVRFRGDLCRTVIPELPNGEVDISEKNFYNVLTNFSKTSPEIGKAEKEKEQ